MIDITDKWNDHLSKFSPEQKDAYYTEEYVKLYETDAEKALCYVYTEDDNCFLMPFLSRAFTHKSETYYDFETAYGYGGPIYNTTNETFVHNAWAAFMDYANKNHYVCGFVRFHPILNNVHGFEEYGKLYLDRKTIAIDLSGGIEATWMNEIHTKNRNVIKKGEKNGLHFIVDDKYEQLSEFIELYNSTMDKLSAEDFYYFQDAYYENLKNNIKDSFLGLVEHEGKFVAAAIFFYSLPYGHYHLAGSDRSALSLSPNNFLLWNAAKELTNRGVQKFHLGGGTDGNEDNSLFQYKRKFSKSEYQFSFGKLMFNQEIYDSVVAEWEAKNPEKAEKLKYILLKYKY